eukprot:m.233983 g.233983  ORF g.233983 m.233983 type:complete len:76 (-) comp15251_c1_seq1:345-572(-)
MAGASPALNQQELARDEVEQQTCVEAGKKQLILQGSEMEGRDEGDGGEGREEGGEEEEPYNFIARVHVNPWKHIV